MTGPLQGLRIGVTRAQSQAGRLCVLLRAEGAEPVELAVLELHEPPSWEPFDAAIAAWRSDPAAFDGLVLTSANAVERAAQRAQDLGVSLSTLAGSALVAVVGAATAQAARGQGLEPHVVPAHAHSEGLLAALEQQPRQVRRWFIPRALHTREVLAAALAARGALVREAPVYRTGPPSDPSRIRDTLADGLDAITFCSGSAVEHLRSALGSGWPGLIATVPVASIGPVTSAACVQAGLDVAVQAQQARLDSLVQALVSWAPGR